MPPVAQVALKDIIQMNEISFHVPKNGSQPFWLSCWNEPNTSHVLAPGVLTRHLENYFQEASAVGAELENCALSRRVLRDIF